MRTRELEEYCQRRGWEIAGCYVDTGISGSKESRPELDRLWFYTADKWPCTQPRWAYRSPGPNVTTRARAWPLALAKNDPPVLV